MSASPTQGVVMIIMGALGWAQVIKGGAVDHLLGDSSGSGGSKPKSSIGTAVGKATAGVATSIVNGSTKPPATTQLVPTPKPGLAPSVLQPRP